MSSDLAAEGRTPLARSVPFTHTFAFAMVALALVGVMSDVQAVALQPLIGTMTADLKLSPAQVSWALNAQAISAILAVSATSRLADILGHKKLLVPLMAIGTVGAVVAALASSFFMIIAGRALIGFGIAAPMVWAMIKSKTDAKGMQQAALMSGMVISCATPAALVLGGVMLELGATWSSVFWIICALNATMFVLSLFAPETPETSRSKVPPDWFGAVFLAGSLVCLLLAISQGATWHWTSGTILGLFAAALVLFVVFVAQQRAVKFPMMDFRGMDVRQVSAGYISFGGIGIVAGSMFILIPAMGQAPKATGYGFGETVLVSSLPLLMILPGTLLAGVTSKTMLEKYGPRPPMVLGGAAVLVAMFWGAFVHAHPWQLFVCVFVYGFGIVTSYNIGWALTAAAGRQDNMSLTFGMQYAISAPFGALAAAVILAIMNGTTKLVPGIPTPLPVEGTYTANFMVMAGAALTLIIIQGLTLTPKVLTHHGVVPEPAGIAVPEEGFVVPAEPDTIVAARQR
jgi:MFS family permease